MMCLAVIYFLPAGSETRVPGRERGCGEHLRKLDQRRATRMTRMLKFMQNVGHCYSAIGNFHADGDVKGVAIYILTTCLGRVINFPGDATR